MRTWIPLACLLFGLLGCGDGKADKGGKGGAAEFTRFAFDSGGSHHIEGQGAWRIEVRRGPPWKVAIVHQVREALTHHGPYDLEPAEVASLWEAIERAEIPSRDVADRPGVPDESAYAFMVERGGRESRLVVWQNDLAMHPELVRLKDALRALVVRHTEESPVF